MKNIDREIFFRFFEGKVSEAEKDSIMNWIEESPQHKATFLKERKIFDAIQLASLDTPINTKHKIASYLYNFARVAAISIVTLMIAYYFNNDAKSQINGFTEIVVPGGQHVKINLPDGSEVNINARSKFTYASDFGTKNREVFLDGEARFDVKHDSNKPFIVNTKKYNVEVYGTDFNVVAYSDSDEFSTTLFSGKVKVISSADATDFLVLKPMSMAVMKNGVLTDSPIDNFNRYLWTEGLISFKEAKFTQIMKDLEYCYGINIVIDNPDLFNLTYTGKFRQVDGVDYALRILQTDFKFEFTKNEDQNVIYIK